ncbi:MAG: BACON domain-containing protein [Candidatus Omnitrophota bacterium]
MKKKAFYLYIIYIIVFIQLPNFIFGVIPVEERTALIALYTSTNGDKWARRGGWKTPPLHPDGFAMPGTEGNWKGVTVSSDHVTQLELPGNKLTGTIPSQLENLGNLQVLNLSHNLLNGSIPLQLANLSQLKELILCWNGLNGPIPPELGNLSKLEYLALNNIPLSGGIPPELGNLGNLQTLDLSCIPLHGGIPSQLGNLENLQTLDLSWNQFSGTLPPELGNLGQLQTLCLNYTPIGGTIPTELSKLTNLKKLELYWNQLTGLIPPELGNLANLEVLALNGNKLSGDIPSELSKLSHLKTLNLGANQFSGSIPPELGGLENLEIVYLNGNKLTGTIPSQLGNLTNLKYLDMEINQLTGAIPPELGNLHNLKTLILNFNNLSGSIPPEIGNLTNLNYMHLLRNHLSGTIPPQLGNLSQLIVAELSYNDLSGSIPPALGSLSNLAGLSLCENQLSGTIPEELGHLENLCTLWLNDNQLTGSIPPQLGNLSSLVKLWLQHNKLSGGIPPELENLNNLFSLFLNNNQLKGEVPPGFLNLAISDLEIGYNCLTATGPELRDWLYRVDWDWDQTQCGMIATVPTVTTAPVSSITATGATCGGNITSDGGVPVKKRGVCWGISPSPTITESKTTDGTGTGNFTSLISGLKKGNVYYVRAYATNSVGIAYGASVRFTTQETPIIALSKNTLNFGARVSQNITAPQTVWIRNGGAGTLNWSASGGEPWLSVSPSSGTGNATLSVGVDPSGLTEGDYTGSIVVSEPDAANSPQTITVALHVYGSENTSAPFGEFSTPEDGASLSHSIPLTGWALDDIGVETVKLYNGNLLIGDAVWVDGARPDVETLYPSFPHNDKAGWGYMLLTDFLPGGGNGTYTLTAKATDREGNEVTLGTKTFTVDNAHAVKPFGAIDTPFQGESISGKEFVSFGWALTPQPHGIPVDGSTIDVVIDGVIKGHPGYNNLRSDIAQLFPGYVNTDGAGGYFCFDTTDLTNGVHTIAWNVTDDAGNSDGIGSRYFTVMNTETSADSSQGDECLDPGALSPDEGDGNDVESVEIKELERLEIALFDNGEILPGARMNGYSVIGDRFKDLPVGSTLDRERGIFYWQPGPGFVGRYRFVFIGTDDRGRWIRKNLILNIKPKS